MAVLSLTTPVTEEQMRSLRAGDRVLLSGTIYTGRDAAHKRMIALLQEGKPLPFDPRGQILYYVGPAPAKPGFAVGSAGPTTSYRMDSYTPPLLAQGLRGMIGKGRRSPQVVDAMKAYGAVYFGAVGGAAALISRRIVDAELVAWPDLGTEAVHRFTVKDFPVTVVIDSLGNSLYETEPPKYRRD
ncbi:MAG TPA: Fe-S-containing hydro-lyase [Firmicutes bacterium]|nr:Fe-S-containing hydro-lyase [Bacillota bacterium]